MKKFLMFFAGVCLLTLTAVSLTSCGDDDNGTVLTGTSWEGTITYSNTSTNITTNISISFDKDRYTGFMGIGGSIAGSYSVSSDNKTVYMEAANGQTVGKISADGKTMEISNSSNGTKGTITKK